MKAIPPPKRIILIGGPTAAGKSALAMEFARREKSNIINADAMQIYRGLPLLTAQPSSQDKAEIPHLLYETLLPSEASSAGKWLALAKAAIDETFKAGRMPIIVGGTGLYFRALMQGLAEIPDIPDSVRNETTALYDKIGEEKFRALLAEKDSAIAARLAQNDRQRLIRAYEVVWHTGKPLSAWQAEGQKTSRSLTGEFLFEKYLKLPPRDALYATCDARFQKMIEQGALEEVKTLLALNLSPELPAMKILGVREIARYLRGEMTLNHAIKEAQQATRNYAKRQMTWFRNQWKDTEIT